MGNLCCRLLLGFLAVWCGCGHAAPVAAEAASGMPGEGVQVWSQAEWQLLESLVLDKLPPVPAAGNAYVGHPAAVGLGSQLFFDRRLSANGQLSCASCHQPERWFSDGLKTPQGTQLGRRNTPSLLGVAWNTWFFWDGRKDSLWSQALAPLEDEAEHNIGRTDLVRLILADASYLGQYRALFGELGVDQAQLPVGARPSGTVGQIRAWKALDIAQRQAIDRSFANLGKALAAYVATLKPQPGRFDRYVLAKGQGATAAEQLSPTELRGLRLFVGADGQCINCHAGPLFTNQAFHVVGTQNPGDTGRAAVLDQLRLDRFNCLGEFGEARADACPHLSFMQRDRHALYGAYKTPSLRLASQTAPYFHDGSRATLADAIAHYADSSTVLAGKTDLPPITLNPQERLDLEAFLRTLAPDVVPVVASPGAAPHQP